MAHIVTRCPGCSGGNIQAGGRTRERSFQGPARFRCHVRCMRGVLNLTFKIFWVAVARRERVVSLSWAKFESDVISGRIATTQPAATTAREIRLLKACALRHWRTRTATTRSRIACRRASGPPLKRCSRRSWPTFSVANAMAAGGSGERLPT